MQTKVLLRNVGVARLPRDRYLRQRGGYQALATALQEHQPARSPRS